MLNRRGFLQALVGGVATAAAVRTFPFRVFSFPTAVAKPVAYATYIMGAQSIYYDRLSVDVLKRDFILEKLVKLRPLPPHVGERLMFFRYDLKGLRCPRS